MQISPPVCLTQDPAAHYGFPRLVRAGNGDLLVFCRDGLTHAYDDATIAMQISSDGGQTWGDRQTLWGVDPGASAHNPVALTTRSGRIILWCSWYDYSQNARRPCWWSQSDDNGRSWAPFTLFNPTDAYSCYYMTEAIQTTDGLLAGDATFPPSCVGNCHTRIWHSADDGESWTVRANLTGPEEDEGNEIALLETEPGVILCRLRDRRGNELFRYWSRDGGCTWSVRQPLAEELDCVLQRPFLTRLDDGAILLSGRDVRRRLVVAYLSTDNGNTFADRLVLDSYQRDGAYTTALAAGPTSCLLSWYSDSHTTPLKPDIKTATLNLEA